MTAVHEKIAPGPTCAPEGFHYHLTCVWDTNRVHIIPDDHLDRAIFDNQGRFVVRGTGTIWVCAEKLPGVVHVFVSDTEPQPNSDGPKDPTGS